MLSAMVGLALAAAGPIPEAKVEGLRKAIMPCAGEDRWAAVEWRADLWAARREAAAAGKPILLWEMDGHPLGCT